MLIESFNIRTQGEAEEEVYAWDEDIAFIAGGTNLIGFGARFGAGSRGRWELIGSRSSAGRTPISLPFAQISSSIGSSTNLAAFRLDPRGLPPLVAVLLLEEHLIGYMGDSEPGTDVAEEGMRGWMESLSAMSNE